MNCFGAMILFLMAVLPLIGWSAGKSTTTSAQNDTTDETPAPPRA